MSRIGSSPIELPKEIEVSITQEGLVECKGPKGILTYAVSPLVVVKKIDNILLVEFDKNNFEQNQAAGTTRANLENMVKGVTQGFEKKLTLIGVGYRASVKGQELTLNLGFSHPIIHNIPKGITVETISPTEVIIKGNDKKLVGQTAAEIREYRPPEPYKGKGIRYSDEKVVIKETKKK